MVCKDYSQFWIQMYSWPLNTCETSAFQRLHFKRSNTSIVENLIFKHFLGFFETTELAGHLFLILDLILIQPIWKLIEIYVFALLLLLRVYFEEKNIRMYVCIYVDDIFMLWQHGEKVLKKFLEILNSYHPTIKSTANYSRKISFLDVEVIKGNQLVNDLYIKPTDTHRYLHASSCHVFHSKKSIPYSQALRLNRICSENSFFVKRCIDLEIWLKGRGYSGKLVRKQILKARKFSRAELLNSQRKKENEDKLVLDITYHPSLAQLKVIMSITRCSETFLL